MGAMPGTIPRAATRAAPARDRAAAAWSGVAPPVLVPWLRAQSINVTRHAAALRPFRREEFGTGAASPSEGHIQAVNTLITSLRRGLLKMTKSVTDAAATASQEQTASRLQQT